MSRKVLEEIAASLPAHEPPKLLHERRWPVAFTILAATILLGALPYRIRLLPSWFPYLLGALVLVPMVAVELTGARERYRRIERKVTLLFIAVMLAGTLINLTDLVLIMVRRSKEMGGVQLLESSIAVWMINVLAFALLYWQMDRGGPEDRIRNRAIRPDWLFPQESAPAEDVRPDWNASFIDYLFLAFSTATAFSTTDVAPLTGRAKLLMMFEAAISLATIVIVAARAINVLGS